MTTSAYQLSLTDQGAFVRRSEELTNSQSNRVAIVLVNWNNSADTLDCIKSLGSLNYQDSVIVVVENHSRPDEYSALQSQCGEAVILRQKRNLGFAGGCNAGIRWALRNGFDYIWLVNNDAEVAPDSLQELVHAMKSDPNIGIAGGVMYYWSDPERIQTAGGFMESQTKRGGMLGQDELDTGQFSGVRDVDYVSGGMLLVRSAAIAEVGLMDERFFMYYEDTDWGIRMRESGWRVVTTGEAKSWHKDKASAGTKKPYFIQHGYFMFLYKNSRHRLGSALRLYASHQLRPHLTRRQWRLAWADAKVYWMFLTRLAFVKANLQP